MRWYDSLLADRIQPPDEANLRWVLEVCSGSWLAGRLQEADRRLETTSISKGFTVIHPYPASARIARPELTDLAARPDQPTA